MCVLYKRGLRISTEIKHVEIIRNEHFKLKKTKISSTLLNKYMFQMYHCESGIAVFA